MQIAAEALGCYVPILLPLLSLHQIPQGIGKVLEGPIQEFRTRNAGMQRAQMQRYKSAGVQRCRDTGVLSCRVQVCTLLGPGSHAMLGCSPQKHRLANGRNISLDMCQLLIHSW